MLRDAALSLYHLYVKAPEGNTVLKLAKKIVQLNFCTLFNKDLHERKKFTSRG